MAFFRYLMVGALAIALSFTAWALPAQARSCYQLDAQEVCLERVQRSAKYHWRYRVTMTINGQRQPLMRFNCRDRTRTALSGSQKGLTHKFTPTDIGDTLCKLINR